MKEQKEQENIIRNLMHKLEKAKAPVQLRKEVMEEINYLSLYEGTSISKTLLKIWVPVVLVLAICLAWTFTRLSWSGWRNPDLSFHKSFSFSLERPKFFTSLSGHHINMEALNGSWIYYVAGAIILIWFFVILSSLLDRLTKSH